jgi:uncharacterized protein YecA (UPF0149 family)
MRRALGRPTLHDRSDVLDRLAELYGKWDKPGEQAVVAAQLIQIGSARDVVQTSGTIPAPARGAQKLGRNASCWCGSGRKYNNCHLDADRDGKR